MSLTNPISIASREDIPALVSLVNSAYRGEGAKQGWTTEADLLDGIRTNAESLEKEMNTPGAVILKYTDTDQHICGCVYVEQRGSDLYLGMLTVSPNLQAKGLGKRLLAAAEEHARANSCLRVVMTVISVRRELIDWYARHGYRDTGETKPFPTGPEFGIPKQDLAFIVMAKDLQ